LHFLSHYAGDGGVRGCCKYGHVHIIIPRPSRHATVIESGVYLAPLRVVFATGCIVQTKTSSSSCVSSRGCKWASALCSIWLLAGAVSSQVGQALGIICYCHRWIEQELAGMDHLGVSSASAEQQLSALWSATDMPGSVGYDCLLRFGESEYMYLSCQHDRTQIHSRSPEKPTPCATDCVQWQLIATAKYVGADS